MNHSNPDPMTARLTQAAQELFNYAIEREALKQIVAHLPDQMESRKVTVEYELQLLKIISVGWGITFFIPNQSIKEVLSEAFWHHIRALSQGVSEASSASIGKDVDYFAILKERLDIYVNALHHFTDAPDTAKVIGATFAKLCGDEANSYIILAGKRTFSLASASVKNYIESLQLGG